MGAQPVMGISKEQAINANKEPSKLQRFGTIEEILDAAMPEINTLLGRDYWVHGDLVVIPWHVLTVFDDAGHPNEEILEGLRKRLPGWTITPDYQWDCIFVH